MADAVLVIFDFDNTLVDSRIAFGDLRRALVNLLARTGPLPEPEADLLRRPISVIVELGVARSPDLAPRLWGLIEAFEADGLRDAGVIPHAPEVLRALAARGWQLALLTNNARSATLTLLDRLGLTGLFAQVVTRDDVPRLKPDPAGIRLILERAGPVRHAFLVGDSWIDGAAAEAAGIPFVGFGPRQAEVQARGVRPRAWVTDLRDLLRLDWPD